jgi:folate-dependent phosphoribosylglycinamide formyltransferase PurN
MSVDQPGYKEQLEEQAALSILMDATAKDLAAQLNVAVEMIREHSPSSREAINEEIARRIAQAK